MNFAIVGINGQLSESQKELRMLYHPSRIKQIKASEALEGRIKIGYSSKKRVLENNKTFDNY